MLRNKKSDYFGTLFLECFGVPWMEWYSKKELQDMFDKFGSVNIRPYGFNLPRRSSKETDGANVYGYFYKIDARK